MSEAACSRARYSRYGPGIVSPSRRHRAPRPPVWAMAARVYCSCSPTPYSVSSSRSSFGRMPRCPVSIRLIFDRSHSSTRAASSRMNPWFSRYRRSAVPSRRRRAVGASITVSSLGCIGTGSAGRGDDFGPAAGTGRVTDESPLLGNVVDEPEAAAVFGVGAVVAHVRDAEGAVITDIDADEGIADRDRDGDRGRVKGGDKAVSDQFRGEHERLIGGGVPVRRLPDEPPR